MAIPDVPPPPLPAELARHTVRVPGVDDVEALYALGSASDVAVIGRTMITRGEVEHSIVSARAKEDSRQVVVERGDRIIAWPFLMQEHPGQLSGDVQVHPGVARPDSDAIAAWALTWFEQIARASFVDGTPERIQLGNWSYEQDSARPEQLRAAGYEPTRAFIRMSRDLPEEETYPAPADGVVVRRADVDPANPEAGDTRLVHSIISASFADHYNYTATPFDLWFQRRVDDPGFDPSLWFIGEHHGTPLAAMITNRELEQEQNAGYVHYLGVLREGRGLGLAKALLYRCFALSRDEGRTSVKLFVDAESPTGATRLYESAGMTREQVILEWQKWLSP